MITWLAKKVFQMKADALTRKAFADPSLLAAYEKYKKDSEAFQARLKRLGVTSTKDLVNAINNNPNIKTKAISPEELDKNAEKLSNQLMSLGIF